MKINYLISVCIIVLEFIGKITSLIEKDLLIFSPFPVFNYNLSSKNGISLKYCIALEVNLTFLAAGYEGIFVID